MDPQASATKVLGVDVDDRCTVADAMLEPERFWLAQAIMATSWGFDVAQLVDALRKQGTAVDYVTIPDANHGGSVLQGGAGATAWLAKQLPR